MKIKHLHIDSFGKFSNKEISFSDGINIVSGENESGKTTVEQFIINSLYGFFRRDVKGRRVLQSYDRLRPWNNPNRFSGKITVEKNGENYTIMRNFLKNKPSVTVLSSSDEDITNDFEYNEALRIHDPATKIIGLSRTAFENTLCVSQRECAAVNTLGEELSEKLSSISQSANTDVSVVTASAYIDKKINAIGHERKNSPYKTVSVKISELENELEEAEIAESNYFVLKQNKKSLEQTKIHLKDVIALTEERLSALRTSAEIKQLKRAHELDSKIKLYSKNLEKLEPYSDINIEVVSEALRKLEALKNLAPINENRHLKLNELKATKESHISQLKEIGLKSDSHSLLDKFGLNYGSALQFFKISGELNTLKDELEQSQNPDNFDTLIKQFDDLSQKKSAIQDKKKQKYTFILIGFLSIMLGIILSLIKFPLLFISAIGLIPVIFALLIKTDTAEIDKKIKRLLAENSLPSDCTRDYIIEKAAQMRGLAQLKKSQYNEKKHELNSLENRLSAYFSLLTDTDWKTNLEDISHAVNSSKALLSEIEQLDISIRNTEEGIAENNSAIEALQNEISKVFDTCGVVNADGLERCYNGKISFDQCKKSIDALSDELERLLNNTTIDALEEKCKDAQIVEIDETEDELKTALNLAYSQSEDCTAQLSAVSERLNAIAESTRTVGEIKAELDIFKAELAELDGQKEALNLAKERLESISRELHNEFAPQLNKAVSECASFISDGRYSKLRLTRNFELFADTTECAEPVSADFLSGGTADMIYLSARIALTDFLSGDGEPLPMIFDDSFVFLDDARLGKFLEFIAQSGRQIIIFTCHSRENDIMKAKKIPFNEIKL